MKTMTALAAVASVAIAASTASFGANLEVTRDLTLDADVACDSVSVAANTTLNLNGHTLRTGGLTGGGTMVSARIDDGVYAKTGLELLSYVESPAAGCYVDTKYKPAAADRLETKFRTGGNVSGTQWILGCYTTNKRMDIYFTSGKFGLHLGSKNNNSLAVAENTTYDMVLDGSLSNAFVGKENAAPSNYSVAENTFTPDRNIWLLAPSGASTSDRYAKSVRMHCFRVFDASGNLKVNMVPAKKDGVVGFYDTVRETFHEPADGTLTAGETISYYALDYARTPDDNSTVSVDTGYWPRGFDSIDATVTLGSTGVQGIFSSRQTYQTRSFSCCIDNKKHFRFDHLLGKDTSNSPVHKGADGAATEVETGRPYRIHANGETRKFSLDGVESPDVMCEEFDVLMTNIVLFALADSSTGEASAFAKGMSMHGFRVTDPRGYVRLDLVPAKLVADGTVGFYDRARNAFIRPQGGALEGGAELPRDLTAPDGACWSSKVVDGNTVLANLFSGNFKYEAKADSRVYINNVSLSAASPWSIDYDFGEGNEKVVNMYRITGGYANRTPVSWNVYGGGADAYASTDAAKWTLLHSVSGEPAWTEGEQRVKAFKNDTAYRFYRIAFSKKGTNGYTDLTQLEYFGVGDTTAPGVLTLDVGEGVAVTNATMIFGADMKVVKEGAGAFAACAANAFYTGGTVVKEGSFTVGAPLATAMTLADGATLGFMLSQDATSPLLSLDAASSFPSAFGVEVGRSDSFKIPRDGFALTDGFDFGSVTPAFSRESWMRGNVDEGGNLWLRAPGGFIIIFR